MFIWFFYYLCQHKEQKNHIDVKLDQYEYFSDNNFENYFFYSNGPKGRIKKGITYTKFNDNPIIYNLAFGDFDPYTQHISDVVKSNNLDRDRVLATVANTIHEFSNHCGNPLIFATGSTPARTRLYQISIAKLLDEILREFDIYGITNNLVSGFKKNVNYTAFLVKRKQTDTFNLTSKKGFIMPANKRSTITYTKASVTEQFRDYSNDSFVVGKVAKAKEIMSKVKLPDHLTSADL